MKKGIAWLLAMLLVLALCVPGVTAYAEGEEDIEGQGSTEPGEGDGSGDESGDEITYDQSVIDAFPDEAFRKYVMNLFDINNADDEYIPDGFLSDDEKANAETLFIDFDTMQEITDLTGIKEFPNLRELECSDGFLDSLDVSGMKSLTKLVCNSNGLESLNLSGCTSLRTLECYNNNLATLDITGCDVLNALATYSEAFITQYAFGSWDDPYAETIFEFSYFDDDPDNDDILLRNDSQTPLVTNPELKYVTITFDAGEGIEVPKAITLMGCAISKPKDPERDDAIFLGWYKDKDFKVEVLFADSYEDDRLFTENTTVYAKWLASEEGVGVEIDAAFPDETLREFVKENFDLTGEGWLCDTEIQAVKEFALYSLGWDVIEDFTGIEIFTEMEILNVCNQYAETMDFSVYPKLESLSCPNGLTSLDISKNPKLTDIYVPLCEMETLDFSAYPNLTSIAVSGEKVKSVILGENPNLTGIAIFGTSIESIDLSGVTGMTGLDLYDNKLKTLNVTMLTELTLLDVQGNALTSLDVSKNTKLLSLACWNNKLTSLDVSALPELYELACYLNQITKLSVSKNPFLVEALKGGAKQKGDYAGAMTPTIYTSYENNVSVLGEYDEYVTRHVLLAVDNDTEIEPVITEEDLTETQKWLREHFPDLDFRNAIISFLDSNMDGEVSEEELDQLGSMTELQLGEPVYDFTGLELLTGLESFMLYCGDYVKDLKKDKAITLDFSMMPNLQKVEIHRFHVAELNFSANPLLGGLYLWDCYVESIKFGGQDLLTDLDLSNNEISEVDLRNALILSNLYESVDPEQFEATGWQDEQFLVLHFTDDEGNANLWVLDTTLVITNHSPETCTVSFETNGGDKVEPVTVGFGKTATEPAAPKKENFVFDGWYTDQKLTRKFDFARLIGRDITLYAKWATEYKAASDEEGAEVPPYEQGSKKSYVVVIKASGEVDDSYENLVDVLFNGVSVKNDKRVKITKGSTIIEFSPEFMEELEVGEYALTVEFNDGSVEVPITVEKAQENPTEQGGTEQGGTEQGGTEQGGTEQGGTEQGGTEQGGTEQGGTQQGGTEQGGTQQGGTEQGGTQQGGTEQGGTQQSGTDTPKEETPSGTTDGKEETPSGTSDGKEETQSGTQTPSGTETPSGSQEQGSAEVVPSPKTADNSPIIVLLVLALVAVATIAGVMYKRNARD